MMDTVRVRVGEFQEEQSGLVHLRPLGGGKEWTVDPSYVREATDAEKLSAQLALRNARSRGY
jgi:hypothetical protein